jgi:hypothetical protein
MESKAIKEYGDFAGQDGYLIVDGLDNQTPGGKKLLSELSGSNVPNYPTDVATSDTKRYHLTVGNKAGDLKVGWEYETYYDVANNGGLAKASGGDTISFSIDTKHANEGDVLTYHKNGSTDEVVWAAPGGGCGNPYTKATVTPGDCYLNGKISDSDFPLYDQDVTISNNTYSVLSSPIGYYPDWTDEHEEWHPAHNLDNLVIKLPNNTEFPMAVVEFTVQDSDDNYQQGCVNNVKVKIGETELTRMYSAPYNPNTLLLGGAYHDQFEYWKLVTEPNEGNPYYRIEEIHNEYRGADKTAFAHGTKVQVQIFGSCFNVTISQACGEPAAS